MSPSNWPGHSLTPHPHPPTHTLQSPSETHTVPPSAPDRSLSLREQTTGRTQVLVYSTSVSSRGQIRRCAASSPPMSRPAYRTALMQFGIAPHNPLEADVTLNYLECKALAHFRVGRNWKSLYRQLLHDCILVKQYKTKIRRVLTRKFELVGYVNVYLKCIWASVECVGPVLHK